MTDQTQGTVTIDRLGLEGDGLAGDGRYPFALPGEVILPGPPLQVRTPSPHRAAPVCRHFGTCGGCSLQHADDAFLARWKVQAVKRALAARGLPAPVAGIATSPSGSRRRAEFAARRTRTGAEIGFHTRRSDRIVALAECPLVLPGMPDLFPALRQIAGHCGPRRGAIRMLVTASQTGWDLAIRGGGALADQHLAEVGRMTAAAGIARVALDGEVILQHTPPQQRMGRALVVPPPGAFLQATAEGAAALTAAVRLAIGDAGRVADLFAGCGTFALPLAAGADVHAVEAEAAMLAALGAGWRGAAGLKSVSTEARDLFRRPLTGPELAGYDAVVIDPPRAGAEAQMRALADAGPPVIAAVSCNPITFARDAGILVGGGYALEWIRLVDQFRWSGHVELVARFTRP